MKPTSIRLKEYCNNYGLTPAYNAKGRWQVTSDKILTDEEKNIVSFNFRRCGYALRSTRVIKQRGKKFHQFTIILMPDHYDPKKETPLDKKMARIKEVKEANKQIKKIADEAVEKLNQIEQEPTAAASEEKQESVLDKVTKQFEKLETICQFMKEFDTSLLDASRVIEILTDYGVSRIFSYEPGIADHRWEFFKVNTDCAMFTISDHSNKGFRLSERVVMCENNKLVYKTFNKNQTKQNN